MQNQLDALNDNQRQAVYWNDGPMLVLAGPGSGKTRVLTTRVARLLDEDPEASILALTFTNKAAGEMRERVDALLGVQDDRVLLCTFHSYAAELLRQHGSHLGLRPDFTLLTLDEDRLALLEECIAELDGHSDELPIDRHSILRLFDHLFRESYGGGPVAPGLNNTPDWVPLLFKIYCDALVANNRQDFGSLLYFAARLLREKPGVARVIRITWSHVCVDEFQDTNKAQFDLLRLLVPERSGNLFIVGDDDQIIYQWNGASPERLLSLQNDYDLELIQLPENYRCPPEIVDLANRLIAHNKLRSKGKKPLKAKRPPSGVDGILRFEEFPNESTEAEFVAQDILERGKAASECVVLARTTKLLEGVEQALQRVGLNPYLIRRKSDFESPPVRVLVQALRLANARHDRELLRRLCVAWESLVDLTLEVEDLVASSTLLGGDFLRAWANAAAPRSSGNAALLLSHIQDKLVERLNFKEVVEWFLSEGNKAWKAELGSEFERESDSDLKGQFERDLEEELNIWQDFHDQQITGWRGDSLTLSAYLQSMDLESKVPPPPPNAVHCLTVHGAKGLEFKHVYLIGMSQEVLPSFHALRKGPHSRELEEERRNCFVAITRSQETLTLTRSQTYRGWHKGISQFLLEMAGEEE